VERAKPSSTVRSSCLSSIAVALEMVFIPSVNHDSGINDSGY
jgi:hypothetical protein